MSVERGVRESFLAFFADSGIVFQPHPAPYKALVKDRPAPQNPNIVTLTWKPIFADAAEFGDLGYTTGPYTLTDNSPDRRPPQYGFFFSIWKRQRDGLWKVVLDAGIHTPEPYTGPRMLQTPRQVTRNSAILKRDVGPDRNELREMDRVFLKSVQSKGIMRGYSEFFSAEARLHRQNRQPILGIDSIRAFLSGQRHRPSWAPMYSDVSYSVDLGYTYGSYELKGPGSNETTEKGYYARVWKNNGENKWKVVLEVTIPLPKE